MLALAWLIVVVVSVYLIFNPYLAWKWRTDEELWRTREHSYGWPFYSRIQTDPMLKRKCLSNPVCKAERLVGNTIYIE